MKCANCKNDASYIYRITFEKSLYYCKKDLPRFLEERRRAGFLDIPKDPKLTVTETVEEPILDELTEETEKPKKKAAKKKAE